MSISGQTTRPTVERPERCRVAHAWLNDELYELLELEAARRGTHPDRLAAYIVGITVRDGLVEAILDR